MTENEVRCHNCKKGSSFFCVDILIKPNAILNRKSSYS